MRYTSWLLAPIALVAMAPAAQAQEDLTGLFTTRYAALRAAMQANDEAAIKAVLAPGYEGTDIRGETRDAQGLLTLAQRMAAGGMGGERKMDTAVAKVTLNGALATVEQTTTATMKRLGDDGAEHTMEMIVQAQDTWVKQGETWLLWRGQQTRLSVKRDGEELFSQGG